MLNTPTQGESVCGVRFLRHVFTSQLVVGVCMCFLSVTSESHDRITEVAEGSHWKNLGEEVSEIVCSVDGKTVVIAAAPPCTGPVTSYT